jgi:hypothetical protein
MLFTVCGHECCQSKKGSTKNARRHSRHTTREKFCSSGDIYKSSSGEAARCSRTAFGVCYALLTLFVGGGCTELIQFAFILALARGDNSRIHFEAVALKNEYLPGCELIWHSERVDKLN